MTKIKPGSIVVGADGSSDSDRAVQWAAEQAALERRPLVVLCAASPTPALVAAGPGAAYAPSRDDLLTEARATADAAVALAARHRSGLSIGAMATADRTITTLVEASTDAHLVVLGSRGRGPFGSKLLGSVSATVAKHAECPVVVCRPGTELRVKQGVLVGADGTADAVPVLDYAFRQASLRSQPLTILHAFFDVLGTVDGPRLVGANDPAAETYRLLLSESVAGFRERYPEVRVDLEMARGFPADTLAVLADRYDLVVVGRHPRDTMTRRLRGGIATAVLERSHTNVAVVPEPTTAPAR